MAPFPGLELTIPFSHIDAFGHVNHARYLEYFEQARFAWAAWYGMPIDQMMVEGYGPAIISAQVRWRRELRMNERVRVTVDALSARRGIGRVHQQIWRLAGEEPELCAEGELAFVMLDLKERTLRALPEIFVGLVAAKALTQQK